MLRPPPGKIVVRQHEAETQVGIVLLAVSAQEKPQVADVVFAHPTSRWKPEDRILYSRFSRSNPDYKHDVLDVDGEKLIFMPEDCVYARLA